MGLLSLIITVGLMMLGAGYYFFSMPSAPLSITNDTPAPDISGLPLYEHLKGEAEALIDSEESRVEEEIAELEAQLAPPKIKEEPQKAPEKPSVKAGVIERLMSTGFSAPAKARSIDTIVLHSSYNPNEGDAYSVEKLVQIYESYGVGAHYLIDRTGKIYRLVEDKNIAYHAGVSKMPDGRKDVNTFSIGIEIMNKEETQYTAAQYAAVNELIASLKERYGIKYVVGHGDIAPTRKTDPWNFDWKKLK